MPGWWDQQTKANLDHQPCGMERGKNGQEQEAELERHPGILTLILICEFSDMTKQFSDSCWVFYYLTQFWHYPSKDRVRSHRLRVQSHNTVSYPYLYFSGQLLFNC